MTSTAGAEKRPESPEVSQSTPNERSLNPRYDSARILLKNGIPCVIWGEDALKHYGVPTGLFDVYLLVNEREIAYRCLQEAGYNQIEPNWIDSGADELSRGVPRLVPPGVAPVRLMPGCALFNVPVVVLVQPDRWRNIHLPPMRCDSDPFPSLPWLVDSIIDASFDTPDSLLGLHFQSLLAYIYEYINEVKNDPAFVNKLGSEHRDFHMQCLYFFVGRSHQGKWKQLRDSILQSKAAGEDNELQSNSEGKV